ncbi:PIG-L family deacetylase [Crenobacter caeni]|uniref:PIG-L family deacetylase n=1 Tax=Crenobacter caeni TaxID=2705474 RepID=A0A6B2KQE2_9NEIS|nr:PIG-L family deacetylase [Crenobacter caeni]NDV12368.1 hypothetical protein [Crenobacter caeni]
MRTRFLANPNLRLNAEGRLGELTGGTLATLDAADAALWRRLQQAVELTPADEDENGRLSAFAALGWCVEAAPANLPVTRRPVLVAEPHMDDAAFSIGAHMLSLRGAYVFTLVSAIGRSNFTRSAGLPGNPLPSTCEVSALRTVESRLAAAMLAGHHLALGFEDAPLRHLRPYGLEADDPTVIARELSAIGAFVGRPPSSADVESLETLISETVDLSRYAEVWLPLGLGHTDHVATRDAWLKALSRAGTPVPTVRLYEDLPYAARVPGAAAQVLARLRAAGCRITSAQLDLGAAQEAKRRLCGVYRSQFDPQAIWQELLAATKRQGETLHTLDRLPDPDLWRPRPATAALLPASCPRTLALYALMPSGRWTEDLPALRAAYPHARIDVYAAPEAAAECARLADPRLTLSPLPDKGLDTLRLLARQNRATLGLLIGPRRWQQAARLLGLARLARVYAFASFAELVSALPAQAEDGHAQPSLDPDTAGGRP